MLKRPTPEQWEKIEALREQGICKTQIAKIMGMNQKTFFKYLDEHDGVCVLSGCARFSREETHKRGGVYFDVGRLYE